MGDKPPTMVRKRNGRRNTAAASAAGQGLNGPAQEPDFVRLLDPDGERVEHPDYPVDFTDDEYRGLYRDLAIVRRLDTESTALCRQGQLGIWASLEGQEAAQIGSGRALRPQDMAFPTYREHGVLWCRGIDPIMPLSLFRGADLGGWDPAEQKLGLYTIVIGAQTLHATGYAMGVGYDGKVGGDEGEAVIAYLGDGASSEGDVHESFVFASVYHAPVVFFCQNNQYAISEPVERQAKAPIHARGAGYGFPGVMVDGNDVLACYAVTRKALDDARHGQGPSLIEAYTYRIGPHTTNDDPSRYRVSAEVEAWQQRDPILRMRSFLTKQKLAGDDFFGEVADEAERIAMDLRERVVSMPDPAPGAFFEHVYAGGSPLVDAERSWFHEYRQSFDAADGGH